METQEHVIQIHIVMMPVLRQKIPLVCLGIVVMLLVNAVLLKPAETPTPSDHPADFATMGPLPQSIPQMAIGPGLAAAPPTKLFFVD